MTVSALSSASSAPIPVLNLAGTDEEVAATLKEARPATHALSGSSVQPVHQLAYIRQARQAVMCRIGCHMPG